MKENKMPGKIFLSYAHEDRDLVSNVEQALRDNGIVSDDDVIIKDVHEPLKFEFDYRKIIKDKISSAHKVVIIASDNSGKSQWVNYEAGMAAALDKPIVVIGMKGEGMAASQFNSLENVQSIELERGGLGTLSDEDI